VENPVTIINIITKRQEIEVVVVRRWVILAALLVLLAPNFTWAGETCEEKEAEVYHTPAKITMDEEWTIISDWSEEREAELYHTPAEMIVDEERTIISDWLSYSGLLEVEALLEYTDGERSSEILLSTVQLELEGFVSEEVSLQIVADFDDEDLVQFDEATIAYDGEPWVATLGIQYVAFGYYSSDFISGTLTADLGVTRQKAFMAGFVSDGLDLSVWVANGDADEAGKEDRIDDYGHSFIVTALENFEFGVSFISDMAETDAELVSPVYSRSVSGASALFALEAGDLELTGEYLTATSQFSPADLDEDGDGKGDTPSAFNAEIAWVLKEDMGLAVRVAGSAEFVDEPESQYGICFSYGRMEEVSLSLEYLHEEFNSDFSDEQERDALTTLLGIEF
jgi:hypothetical protein